MASVTIADESSQAFDRFAKKEEIRLQQQLDEIQVRIAELELNDKKNRLQQSTYIASKSGIFLFAEQQKPKSVNQDVAIGKIVEHVSKFAKDQGASSAQFEVRISLNQSSDLIAGLSLTGKIMTESKKLHSLSPHLQS